MRVRTLRPVAATLGALLVVSACSSSRSGVTAVSSARATSGPAGASVGAVCGKTRPGPATAPAGAVRVDPSVAGDLATKTAASPPGTVFWLAPGRHRLGGDRYSQVKPKARDTYLGAPGAVLDGGGKNSYAFVGDAADVTIASLVVRGFVPPLNEGVVNHDSA